MFPLKLSIYYIKLFFNFNLLTVMLAKVSDYSSTGKHFFLHQGFAIF